MKQNDEVICKMIAPFSINRIAPELEMDKEYVIENAYTCKCGELHVDVGLPLNINYVECYKCRETLPMINKHWCNSSRFILKAMQNS